MSFLTPTTTPTFLRHVLLPTLNLQNLQLRKHLHVVTTTSPTLSHALHLSLRQEAEQRLRDGESQRPRLAQTSAAAHAALKVKASKCAHELQREHELLSDGERRAECVSACVCQRVCVCVCETAHLSCRTGK